MTFDFSSFLNTWICCLLLGRMLGRINQGHDRPGRFRHRFLTFLYWLIIVRLLLPANFIFGIPSPFYRLFSRLDLFLSASAGPLPLSFYALLSYIWLAGAVISLSRFMIHREREKEVARILLERGTMISVRDLSEDYAGPDFKVCLSRDIETPFVYGFMSIIVIPDRPYTKDQLFYIVSHETMHLFNHDASYCLLANVLTRIYWWMPGLSSLRKNTSSMIELRVDGSLMELFSNADLLGYCEALIDIARPDYNPLVSGPVSENVCIGNRRILEPGRTVSKSENREVSKSDEANLEVLAFGEPNTDLETRIHYCLSAHEKPETAARFFWLTALIPLLFALCLGMQSLLPL